MGIRYPESFFLPLNNNENATIKVDLPDYYFNFPKQNRNNFLILLFDIVLVGLAVLFFLPFWQG